MEGLFLNESGAVKRVGFFTKLIRGKPRDFEAARENIAKKIESNDIEFIQALDDEMSSPLINKATEKFLKQQRKRFRDNPEYLREIDKHEKWIKSDLVRMLNDKKRELKI